MLPSDTSTNTSTVCGDRQKEFWRVRWPRAALSEIAHAWETRCVYMNAAVPAPRVPTDWLKRLCVCAAAVDDREGTISTDTLVSSEKRPLRYELFSFDRQESSQDKLVSYVLEGTPQVTAEDLIQVVNSGYSLRINHIDMQLVDFAMASIDLSILLGIPAHANLYITPPGAAALPPHYDDHCVVVVQLLGAKQWQVWGSPLPLPLLGATRLNPSASELSRPPHFDGRLEAGDVLYVPRGSVHCAYASNESFSVHVTFALEPWEVLTVSSLAHAYLCSFPVSDTRRFMHGIIELLSTAEAQSVFQMDATVVTSLLRRTYLSCMKSLIQLTTNQMAESIDKLCDPPFGKLQELLGNLLQLLSAGVRVCTGEQEGETPDRKRVKHRARVHIKDPLPVEAKPEHSAATCSCRKFLNLCDRACSDITIDWLKEYRGFRGLLQTIQHEQTSPCHILKRSRDWVHARCEALDTSVDVTLYQRLREDALRGHVQNILSSKLIST